MCDDGGPNTGDYRKLSLRVILILGVAITLVTFVVARNQVRSEKQGLRSDLEKRVETLAESLQETVEPVVQRGAASQLSPVLERFASREHLAGIAVFDELGRAIAVSSKLPAIVVDSPICLQSVKAKIGVSALSGQSADRRCTTMHFHCTANRKERVSSSSFTTHPTSKRRAHEFGATRSGMSSLRSC